VDSEVFEDAGVVVAEVDDDVVEEPAVPRVPETPAAFAVVAPAESRVVRSGVEQPTMT
jgi:hypothetical protein